jgi:hypothetical protein
VAAFAFVAASFIARNTDLWLHLATGRLLAGGEYRFGTDPFSYTTAGRYWANHAWLFDLAAYLVFSSLGGPALVVMKAVAVAATAGVMLSTARTRGPAWIGTGCILLAVLAMSPRLLLQPAVGSMLLLAVCVWCLRAGGRWFRAVPVLVAIWVNVDGWFVLGPAVVGLFWLGRRLDPTRAELPPWPVWLFPAAIGACLLSPHHLYALTLPAELSPGVRSSAFATDPRFAGLFASPWRWGPMGSAGGYSPAAWAFVALLLLGLGSFAANRGAIRGWRAAVWIPFALLAAWQARLIPFFAVVAGPITALNLREVWPDAAYSRPGRLLVVATAVVLLGLGWLGWLNGVNARDRGLAWGVYTDPTLARTAVGVGAWRHASSLSPEARVFATHPDVGHYIAWHAPSERYFLDSRLTLFTPVASEFEEISRAVGVLPDGAGPPPADIAAVVLYDPEPGRTARALASTAAKGWGVARVDGSALLLIPRTASGVIDLDRAAFGGTSDLPVAWAGPENLAEPVPWRVMPGAGGRKGSWEADAATTYLRLAETGSSQSPAAVLLAVRAARAGIEIDPADPTAWLALGHAYLMLGERSWEREVGAGLSPLEQVRFFQAVGALTRAARLNPEALAAHQTLSRLFARRNAIDLAHRHAVRTARLVRRGGPVPGEAPEAFDERAGQAEKFARALEESVQDAQNRFLVRTAGLGGEPLVRARVAAELGLVQQAVDVLLESHPDLYGPVGIGLLAELLLQTGQIAECRTLLDRDELRANPHTLGYYNLPRRPNPDGSRRPYRFHAYDWLDLCQCAAAGRYAGVDAALGRLTDRLATERRAAESLLRGMASLVASDVGRAVPPLPVVSRLWTIREQVAAGELLAQVLTLPIHRADLLTLGGVLDLERGDGASAAGRFAEALALYAAAPTSWIWMWKVPAVIARPGEALAARYQKALRSSP